MVRNSTDLLDEAMRGDTSPANPVDKPAPKRTE